MSMSINTRSKMPSRYQDELQRIRISTPYHDLRVAELRLTADFLQKQASDREAERLERERLREERKVQQEIDRERAVSEKERQHYENALAALVIKGDQDGADRLRQHAGELLEFREIPEAS